MSAAPTLDVLSKDKIKERVKKVRETWIQNEVDYIINAARKMISSTDVDYISPGIVYQKTVSKVEASYKDELFSELKHAFPDSAVYVNVETPWWSKLCCNRYLNLRIKVIWR